MTTEQKATNITWHQGEVSKTDREQLLKQKGVTLWLTGLSGSGKSTVSAALEQRLHQLGHLAYRLDGDNVRHGLNKDLGFSPEDRTENIRRVAEVSKLFVDAGLIVTTSFISPYQKDREDARAVIGAETFLEVYIKCPIEKCEQRDPKGLYKKARSGEIPEFTGVSAPYEEPTAPDIVVETDQKTIEEAVEFLVGELRARGFIF